MWDHIAFDPQSKMVISLIQSPGRDQEACNCLVTDFAAQTNGTVPRLITTDEHAAYKTAILTVYGWDHRPRRRAKRGRKKKLIKVSPPGLTYATVHKNRERGQVVDVEPRLVLGKADGLAAALTASDSSRRLTRRLSSG